MPRLQRLQGRLPGQRRHGDVQGRVSLALLGGTSCVRDTLMPSGLIDQWARLGVRRAGIREPDYATAGAEHDRQESCRHAARTRYSRLCAGELQVIGFASGRCVTRVSRRVILWADTFNNYFTAGNRAGRGRSAGALRLSGRRFPCSTCAADVRCTTTAFWIEPSGLPRNRYWRRWRMRSMPELRWSCWSRVAARYFAMS